MEVEPSSNWKANRFSPPSPTLQESIISILLLNIRLRTATSSHVECIRNSKWHWLGMRDVLVAIYSSKRDASPEENVPSIHYYRSTGIPLLFHDVQQSQCQCQMQCLVVFVPSEGREAATRLRPNWLRIHIIQMHRAACIQTSEWEWNGRMSVRGTNPTYKCRSKCLFKGFLAGFTDREQRQKV